MALNSGAWAFRRQLWIAFVVALVSAGQPIASAYAISGVSTPVQVSTPQFGQFTEPAVVADPTNAQNVFVSSNEGSCVTTIGSGQPSLISSNGGTSWSTGQALPTTAGHNGFDPAPAFDANGILYDSYLDVDCLSNPPQGNLVVSKSTDKGSHWTRLTTIESSTSTGHPDKPMLLADTTSGSPFSNRLYVVYSRVPNPGSPNPQPLELNYSTDGGATWLSTPKQVDPGNDTGGSLAIGPTGGYLYVAWWDYTHQKIRTSKSTDGGNTFTLTTDHVANTVLNGFFNIANYVGNGIADNPTIGVDRTGGANSGKLYIVWGDRLIPPSIGPTVTATSGGALPAGSYQIAYSYITSLGETAASPTATVILGTGQSAIQTGTVSNIPPGVTSVHYYLVGVPSNFCLTLGYVGSSTVSGGSAPGITITGSGNSAPASNGNMHILFSGSTDQGATWSSPTPLRLDPDNPNDAWQPTLAVDQSNGIVTVAWYDRRDDLSTPNKNYLVYYTYSSDGGRTFLPQQIPTSTSSGDPTVDPARAGTGDYMAMASGSGSAHPVWVETHPVNPPTDMTVEMQVFTTAVTDNQPLNNWRRQQSAAPLPNRDSQSMAYDAATRTVVMFGGYTPVQGGLCGGQAGNETWTWDGATWTQVQPANRPPVRTNAAMAYDAATGKVILFGGADLNDTWSWDGTNWTLLSPRSVPPARGGAGMVYDSALSELVMFGGVNNSGLLSDTWAWTGTNWAQQKGAGPSGRWGPQMAYDSAHSVVVLFGGGSVSTCPATMNGDTWTWNGKWAQQHPTTSPSPREGGGMDYDGFIGQSVLFGGSFISSSCGPITYYNDTWYWNGSNWTVQSSPAVPPTARTKAGLCYDAATSMIVLTGGTTSSSDAPDTWSY
jgi:hypothetical protein